MFKCPYDQILEIRFFLFSYTKGLSKKSLQISIFNFKKRLHSLFSCLQGLWLVCGFFANLPTASSIQCYACADYIGSSEPCNDNASVIQCESYVDSCSTLTTTVEIFGNDYTSTVKNCSIAQVNCDSTFICDQVNSSMVSAGGSMKECDLSCCHGDLCNGGGCSLYCYSQKVAVC